MTWGSEQRERGAITFSLLLLRFIVGFIFTVHGSQKLFGLFDGPGLVKTMAHLGPVLGVLVSIGEFFGGLGLIVGFLSRFSAAALLITMLGAIITVHGKNGFFLEDKGYEYNLALIGLLLPVLIAGPGNWAVLRLLFPRLRQPLLE